MTIKPIPNQKSSDKKESHGHNHQDASQQNLVTNSRTNRNKSSVEVQSSQLRNDVYDDITRHRRSPHKLSGRSKREHHHKRGNDRSERDREKICKSPQYVQTQHTSCVNTNQLQTTVCNNQQSGKSPKHISTAASSSATASLFHQQQQKQQQSANNVNLQKFLEEKYSGYNSGDEHLVPGDTLLTPDEWKNRDEKFVKEMSERGLIIQDIVEDGACLFRAISLQIYGDQEMHEVIRQQTMDYIYQNREYYAHFVTEDINSYVKRKRNKDSHGNHIEIQAMSEIYNRPVELYCYGTKPINIFNPEQLHNGYDPLRLSYQRGSHYNAVLDPYNASVGVGLGLAGYKPESQTREAIRLSEQLEIEKTMFEDKLKTTDWEATNEAIEEQIARESYLQWCRENMQKAACSNNNHSKLSSQNSTSSTVTSAEAQNMNNNTNCETSVALCILNESSSSSTPASLSKDVLQQFHNNNNSSNTNNSNINTDSNCDREQMNDQQSSLLVSKNLANKKKNDSNNVGGSSSCINSNNGKESGNNAIINDSCNSPCDSDDTDMSSTSSIDQYQHFRFKSSSSLKSPKMSKQHNIKSRRSKRKNRDYEMRNAIAINEKDFVTAKRSKQCLEKLFQQQNNFECDKGMKSSLNNDTTTNYLSKQNITFNGGEEGAVGGIINDKMHSSSVGNMGPCSSKQMDADNKPISKFYQSLLESSYTEDGLGQLSESEMLQKALEMSRIDFIEEQKRKFSSDISNNGNDRRANNSTTNTTTAAAATDYDSDTLST